MSEAAQRRLLDALRDYNAEHHAARADNTNLAARIASYELAFAMQRHAPEAVDLASETGGDEGALRPRRRARPQDFGRRCLLARRLVERGVRFVQLYAGGAHNDSNWDAHGDLVKNHNYHAGRTDKPIAGLLKDLKRRGLLDETLVDLGRRVRPPADRRVRQGHRPRPQRLRLHDVDGRRRHQGRRQRRRDRRARRAPPSPTASTSRTCTPPSCTSWASTPNRLTYFYSGLDQKLVGVEGAEPIHQVMA